MLIQNLERSLKEKRQRVLADTKISRVLQISLLHNATSEATRATSKDTNYQLDQQENENF